MSPSAITTATTPVLESSVAELKKAVNGHSNGVAKHDADVDVQEDYAGDYRFAPIEEAQVSRAMIKRCVLPVSSSLSTVLLTGFWLCCGRYFDMMYDRAVSDVVVVGAGSAGLSCTYHLAKTRPDLKVTLLESNVAPGGGAWLGGQLMTPMVRIYGVIPLPSSTEHLCIGRAQTSRPIPHGARRPVRGRRHVRRRQARRSLHVHAPLARPCTPECRPL